VNACVSRDKGVGPAASADVFPGLDAKRKTDPRLDEAMRTLSGEIPPPWPIESLATRFESERDEWLRHESAQSTGPLRFTSDCTRCAAFARVLGATGTPRAAAALGVTWDHLQGGNFGEFRTAVLETLFENYVKDVQYGLAVPRGGDMHGLQLEAVDRWWSAHRVELLSRQTGVEVGSTLAAATPTKTIFPVLPRAAVEQGRVGPVLVEITVASDGTVHSPRILRGDVLLNDLALEAIRQWRYEPFVFAGQPHAAVITVAVPFKK